MTVKVAWVQKKRGDNHAPKFRPTNSDDLDKTERNIYQATLAGINAIPEDTFRRLIYNLMDPVMVQSDLMELLLNESEDIALAIFAGYVEGARDMAHRIREQVNRDLSRLGSELRLVGVGETQKATVSGVYEPFEWTSGELSVARLFDQQPDNMTGKVYARLRANNILSTITDDVNENIRTIIQEGFTAQQTFQTGRTVTGLTPQQTARRLYDVLAQSQSVPLTTQGYAEYVAPHTKGLFPRWAKAVDRSMNNYANRLAEQGLSPNVIRERTASHGERYGNKLRRSRARMIARTEIAFAQNQGMYDTLLQAQGSGLFGGQAMKEWITGPTDVCDICVPMGGTKIPVTQNFSWQGGSGPNPPAHPNCRCMILPVPNITQAPNRIGGNVPEDPFRYVFADGFTISVGAGVPLAV